jgi:hypothetical protein
MANHATALSFNAVRKFSPRQHVTYVVASASLFPT